MASEPVIIAVDGPAASGKGTLARRLAAHFDFAYLDTGLLYRALAYNVLHRGEAPEDASAGLRAAQALDLAMLKDPDILAALRTDAVGTAVEHTLRLATGASEAQQLCLMEGCYTWRADGGEQGGAEPER